MILLVLLTERFGLYTVENEGHTMVEKKVLTERIRELCDIKDFSYYNLAAKSGVPLTTVMNIINGVTRNPGIYTVFKLCDGLGISVKDFFGIDGFGDKPDEDN